MPSTTNNWLDNALDTLRTVKLPPLVEFVGAWTVAYTCVLYYGTMYYFSSLFWLPSKATTWLPLTAPAQRTVSKRDERSLYQTVVSKLTSSLGASSDRWNREALISAIREDDATRQLVSELVYTSSFRDDIVEQLKSIWSELLSLPKDDVSYKFALTLILPAFRERKESMWKTIHQAHSGCLDPKRIQVIIVDAGQNEDGFDDVVLHADWGEVRTIRMLRDGGRGPCLNFGASHADGRILTFVHSDTLLPQGWDEKIIQSLSSGSGKVVHACAFRFGHDCEKDDGPPGIRAVRFLGNVRASWFQLPYGDHVLSFPTTFFRYIGGYPDQPIMEDYALMDLLRKRARVLPERLAILDGPSARCSVRRWQKFGVVYVTLVNAVIVSRYSRGLWTADDVFDYYYNQPRKEKLG